jgi:hypothetical protein
MKWNLLPGTADTKAPFPSELDIINVLVLLPASLGYKATKASLAPTSIRSSKLFSVFVPDIEEARSRKKERIQAKLPPMTPASEELESLRWTLLGMYLYIVGGLCLLLAVHVHIHHLLPHERR